MEMLTKEAVQFVLDSKRMSKYALAKSLKSAPVSVNQWLSGTRMTAAKAELFKQLYVIQIEDVYDTKT